MPHKGYRQTIKHRENERKVYSYHPRKKIVPNMNKICLYCDNKMEYRKYFKIGGKFIHINCSKLWK